MRHGEMVCGSLDGMWVLGYPAAHEEDVVRRVTTPVGTHVMGGVRILIYLSPSRPRISLGLLRTMCGVPYASVPLRPEFTGPPCVPAHRGGLYRALLSIYLRPSLPKITMVFMW
jgi:hypothetical protein